MSQMDSQLRRHQSQARLRQRESFPTCGCYRLQAVNLVQIVEIAPQCCPLSPQKRRQLIWRNERQRIDLLKQFHVSMGKAQTE